MWPETAIGAGQVPDRAFLAQITHTAIRVEIGAAPASAQRHQRAVHSANETPATGSRVSGESAAVSALNTGTAASSSAIVAPLRRSHPWIPFRITHPIVPGGHAAWPAPGPLYLDGLDAVHCGCGA